MKAIERARGGWGQSAAAGVTRWLPAAAASSVVLLSGFSADEVQLLREHVDEILWPPPVQLLRADARLLGTPVGELQQPAAAARASSGSGGDGSGDGDDEAAWMHGRIVYFLGGPAAQQAARLNSAMVEGLGLAPAIVAAAQEGHAALPLGDALARVREAHARHWELVRPVATRLADGSAPPPLPEPPVVAMNVSIDRGVVPTSRGGLRVDESSAVVIDGLLTEDERAQLLAWLTAPAHPPAQPPPADKWERACVDRAGDAATWGLRDAALRELREAPVAAAVALQARLAALYPEFVVAHMPAEALLEDDDGQPLSTHVANAVTYGDPCAWHVDADPSHLPPGAPYIEHAGYHYNREPGRPLFVTVLAYLNEEWPEEWHAETLFADPETGTGVFVQPRPGRVVIMDQDMPHRISSPARDAEGPRYSLVWKLLLWPRQRGGGAPAALDGGGGCDEGGAAAGEPAVSGIARPEWGPPQRIGSAAPGGGRVAVAFPPAAAASGGGGPLE
ncbi:hypothetical protein Rsub_13237 [Raphidocelis subcapitata]|uniref:Fe2OG dioxygenase domain-containing protein n=1 Tax=Raphidocelis subcapitata TaxID=307507 RepID=A0A2V0PLQ3_9CHLO|nr:hypothetical protein Rsub_13237 [Raphidocelis subcapitata]|eukprot:GBG00480.1 hypothetical protein Rsub_13237 [Raphidocelis subcapitata]